MSPEEASAFSGVSRADSRLTPPSWQAKKKLEAKRWRWRRPPCTLQGGWGARGQMTSVRGCAAAARLRRSAAAQPASTAQPLRC
eukprot:5940345-Amphidinium_carterae.1